MPPEFSEAGLVEPGPVEPGPVERQLRQKIETTFAPEECSIDNDSPAHQGHAGADEAPNKGESHFSLRIVSQNFAGLSRLERNRAVHRCLAEDMKSIHALTLDLKTPQENAQKNAR